MRSEVYKLSKEIYDKFDNTTMLRDIYFMNLLGLICERLGMEDQFAAATEAYGDRLEELSVRRIRHVVTREDNTFLNEE